MPTFLSDPPPWLYLVLIAVVVATGTLAARNQDRRSLARFGFAAGVLFLVFLIDRLFESPREEATRKVQAMADAATAADPIRFIESVSPTFETNGANRDRLKASPAWSLIRAHTARIAVWGFGQDAYDRISETEIEIGFYAKAEAAGGGMVMRYARARFVKDPDGQYRVKTIKFYNPADRGLNAEEPIPGFP
ncbi:MAG: hypothetical protein JWO38_842 [Gemmataceae bacterium]|nr:hypothetical protein [Gemmataceae bacterium]